MKKYITQVTHTIGVTLDETKFTPEFLEEFRKSFYPFSDINDHVSHLSQLFSRGHVDNWSSLIEGYGAPADFGIQFSIEDTEMEILAEGEVTEEEAE